MSKQSEVKQEHFRKKFWDDYNLYKSHIQKHKADFIWLVGFVEGEGTLLPYDYNDNSKPCWYLSVGQKEKTVLDRIVNFALLRKPTCGKNPNFYTAYMNRQGYVHAFSEFGIVYCKSEKWTERFRQEIVHMRRKYAIN